MLTVLVKHCDSTESVLEAEVIHTKWNEDGYQRVSVLQPDGITQEFTDGIAFVMNENGKTVAKYEMPTTPPKNKKIDYGSWPAGGVEGPPG